MDYPILCCVHQDNKNDKLVVKHLTDADETEYTFQFDNTRFVTFLGLFRVQVENRIAFLGKDATTQSPCIILMSHDSTFKKVRKDGLSKWSVQ